MDLPVGTRIAGPDTRRVITPGVTHTGTPPSDDGAVGRGCRGDLGEPAELVVAAFAVHPAATRRARTAARAQ